MITIRANELLKRGRMDGLSRRERELLWLWFLNLPAAQRPLSLSFFVLLFRPSLVPPEAVEPYRRYWLEATAKKPDVMLEYPDHVTLVEIRPDAESDSLGRLQEYQYLWRQNPLIDKPAKVMLITDIYKEWMAKLAESLQIEYVAVGI